MGKNVSAQKWFALGERVAYDLRTKRILRPSDPTDSQDILYVFRRVVKADAPDESATWTTMLPGFPDGSFGWTKVDQYLAQNRPLLYVEYVGQGDCGDAAAPIPVHLEQGDPQRADQRVGEGIVIERGGVAGEAR